MTVLNHLSEEQIQGLADGTLRGPEGMAAREHADSCDECGAEMRVKRGRFGEFLACSRYPDCKGTKPVSIGVACPKEGCGGFLTAKRSRRGKVFYGCANYPKCDFTLWNKPILEPCPKCGRPFLTEKITKRRGRELICSNEECGYVKQMELEEAVTT